MPFSLTHSGGAVTRRAAWQARGVAGTLDSLVDGWLTIPAAAEQLRLSASKVRQLAKDHQLASVRRDDLREPAIPAAFLKDGEIVKGLSGTLVLLADHGLDDVEAIEWLFTADDTLPGRPIDALREDRGKEGRRRAQALI